MSLRTNRGVQGIHHTCLWMVLAPRFYGLDIFLVRKNIYKCLAGLITEPAAVHLQPPEEARLQMLY